MGGLLTVYQQAIRAGKPFLNHLLRLRVKKGKEDPERLNERRGIAGRPRPAGKLVWIHAASVGEAQSALILIESLAKRLPGINILVTSGTVTSAQLMARRLPPCAFHQFIPLDHPDWVDRFLTHWQPDTVFWMESELWPNLLNAIRTRNIPAALVNARLSERSFSNWQRARGFVRNILGCFSLILAQTEKDAKHFRDLGAENVIVSDNIKYSAAPLPFEQIALSTLSLTVAGRPVWVYASTHAGEEALACRLHTKLRTDIPGLLTIIVPRHPGRREEIAGVCYDEGMKFRLRSVNFALPAPDDDIYVADTLGELGLFYSLAPVAMIGRSFSDDGGGGHNPIEAAQLGCAVVTGPNNQFQRQIYDDMQAEGAVVETQNEEELYAVIRELLSEPHALKNLQRKSESFSAKKAHVAEDVMQMLDPFIRTLENRHAA